MFGVPMGYMSGDCRVSHEDVGAQRGHFWEGDGLFMGYCVHSCGVCHFLILKKQARYRSFTKCLRIL